MAFIELHTYAAGDEPSKRLLLEISRIESIKEASDDAPGLQRSFGLNKVKAASGSTYLEIHMNSGAVHLVTGALDEISRHLQTAAAPH